MDDDLLDQIFGDLPALLLRSEAAAVLRCKDAHVSDLYHRGELAGFQRTPRQGSKLLIPKASLRAYIERHSR